MTKRRNPFEQVKMWTIHDPDNGSWWHEDFESFKDDLRNYVQDDKPLSQVGIEVSFKKMNGKAYNEMLVGSVFGDHEATFVDFDCPKCGHMAVNPNGHEEESLHCSSHDCDWMNEQCTKVFKEEEEEWSKIRSKSKEETPKIRLEGDTLEAFMDRYGFEKLKGKGLEKECVKCKQTVTPSDFYLSFGYAIVDYAHKEKECDNGMCVLIPASKEEKKKWGELLGPVS